MMRTEATGRMRNIPGNVLALPILALVIIILELGLLWSGTPDYLIPAPTSVFNEFVAELVNGRLLRHTFVTLSEALIGFFIALAVGISLAVIVERSRILSEVMRPYITAFQAMPKVAIAPMIIIWFGFGITSKIVLVVFIAFFLVFINTLDGLRSLSAPVLELMRSYGATD